ncbi:MAG: EAL domain-containing protein, partial [Proteobacteria bacterium]|nr:EAL domain-containing protein [Pseudomonadota bacterium]
RFLESIAMPMKSADGETQVLSITSDLTRLVREDEKFRHLLDSSPDAMIITDARGVMRIVNRACETVFGYTRYELIGQPVEMLLPERYRGGHVHHREQYGKRPRVRAMGMGKPLKGMRKGGKEFPVEVALGPIHGQGESMICATVRDLTGVREFEIALKDMADTVAVYTGQDYFDELVKYLSSHFDLHIAIVGLVDSSGENIETCAVGCGGKLERNFTYPLMGTPCAHVVRDRPRFHESDIRKTYPQDRWFQEVGAEGYAGVPLYDADGTVIGLISAISKVHLPNVAGVESFFKLSAARASAELTRLRQIEAIQESRSRYSRAESGTSDGLWDVNMQTQKVYYSPRVSELLGLAPHELGDNPEILWARLHPDDVLATREAHHAHLQRNAVFDVQYRLRHADGSYRWFRTRGRVTRDAAGNPVRFSGSIADITEGKRHQFQLMAENTWLAKFAEAPPLDNLLETIASSVGNLFEGVTLALWLLDGEGEVFVFPETARAHMSAGALRAIAREVPGKYLLDSASREWPWLKAAPGFDRMEARTVADEGAAERMVVAISYPPEVPRQQHENHFMESAERLLGLALAQVSQKREAERQRLLFENLFASSPEAMVILDRDDQVININPRFTEVFQFGPEESRGTPLNDLIVPAEFAREARALSSSAMSGTNVSRETFRCRKDGSLVPVSILGAPITVNGTEAAYFAVYRDQSSLHEAAQRLDFQSRHDQLTGLPNRYEFERRLRNAMSMSAEGEGYIGVLYFDLDQFKVINDTAGHSHGDRVLVEVVRRLRPLVPAPHEFARLGGDEFGVLIVNGRQEECEHMAQEIQHRLMQAPFQLDERVFTVTASFGIVAIEDGSQLDPHEVLSQADSACFLAKERGRNRVQMHDAADMGVAQRREEMDWISRLNEALVEDRFRLYYQRIMPVDGSHGSEHYEILLRMVNQDGAMVPPGVFIPPAERFNLMPRIDRWVLESVFRRLGERGREAQSDLVVAINISGNTLSDQGLSEFVIGLFEQHAVRPQSICFEITETAAIGNFEDALKFIAVVRELGSSVALDDFGSGLSSFRYLKEIAPDYLKIDGSFVREIARSRTDYSMVEAINRVGKTMGVRTIAEFVEDAEILEALRRIGVDLAQGYEMHRPEAWEHKL